MALLSLAVETWQSVQCLVSVGAHRVRHVRAERVAAEALGGDRLLLRVDRLAVVVVRADVDGARRAGRDDAVAGHVAVAGQHEDVVAQRLEVVGRPVAASSSPSLCSMRHLLVGLLRQVAAEAAGSTTSGRRCSSSCCWRGPARCPCAGASPHVVPSRRTVLARRERSERLGLATDHAEAGSIVSSTWTTSHCRSLVDHRVLDQRVAPPLEAPLAERRRSAARGRGRRPARPGRRS